MGYTYYQLRKILADLGRGLGYEIKEMVELEPGVLVDLLWIKGDSKVSFKIGLPGDEAKDERYPAALIGAIGQGFKHFQIAGSDQQIKALGNLGMTGCVIDIRQPEIEPLEVIKACSDHKYIRVKELARRVMRLTGWGHLQAVRTISEAAKKGILKRQELGHATVFYRRVK